MKKLAYGIVWAFAAMSAAVAFAAGTVPAGYTELEYIESSGTQYINTGIAPKTTTRVVCDFQYTATSGQCGWGSTGSKESFFFGVAGDGTFKASVSGNFTVSPTGVAADTYRHTFDISMSALKLDGTAFANATTSPFSNAASGNTLYLFALHAGWSPNVVNYASMRIYSCKIYDGETLVRDFVPVVRASDSKAGLYDLETDAFFGNGGTGDFSAGPEAGSGDIAPPANGARIPEGYTEIEYIQGNGSNARIVTNYTPKPNIDKIEAVVEWPADMLNASQAVWCSRGNGTQVDSWTLFYINDNKKFRYDYMPTGHAVSLVPTDFTVSTATKYTITAEDNTVTYSANGSVLQTQSTPAYSYTAGSVLALFTSHNNGINANVANYGKHRLYSFKVWRSGDLIHYFVPCKDANGAATLVDICDDPATLTKSGTFTAGQEGHYYDDTLFVVDDVLAVAGNPSQYGSPSPAYGKRSGLSAGDTVAVSCGATPTINDGKAYICTGWKLYDINGDVVSDGTETAFTYEHPTPAAYRRLEWQWTALWTLLPIPDQVNETFDPCRPELIMSNTLEGTTWTIGGDLSSPYFDVEYANNYGANTATATVTGKGDYADCVLEQTFNIVATKLEDDNISTTDVSARRREAAGKYVYIFTNAAAAQVSTVKREILLTDYLVAGGGGGGGSTMGGGGGAGGVTNATGIVGKLLSDGDTFTVSVGAGGAGGVGQGSRGGNGKATSFTLGDIAISVAGGGGGACWNTTTGLDGASGGGGTKGGAGGAGIDGIGYAGATAGALSRSGGGGGAGHAGYQYTDDPKRAGNGGEGILSSITGEAVYYGGGGGGGGSSSSNDLYDFGFGGPGGGGDGGRSTDGSPGADGFGGGGGGGGWNGSQKNGGKGGLGTVIVAVRPPAFEIVPIPDQVNETFEPCRPEFVVSNNQTGAKWTVGGDIASPYFDVEYSDNFGSCTVTVTVSGKGELYGAYCVGHFNVTAAKLEDENISTTDTSAKRYVVDGKSVYVFKNASSAATAKRGIFLTDCLLVGGGGSGGFGRAGGGGGGGVTNFTGLTGIQAAKGDAIALAVGAGGAGGTTSSSKGGNGGETSLRFGLFAASVLGGGGGGSWSSTAGAKGASGGGGAQSGAGGAGIDGMGFAGANGGGNNSAASGGGGGAGRAGYAADTTAKVAGAGGEGIASSITGTEVYYGGGGGGGGGAKGLWYGWVYDPGSGGAGGGGNGGKDGVGENGVDGLGGGGGGGGASGSGVNVTDKAGGKGGSGVVILSIVPADFEIDPIPDQKLVAGGSEPLPVVHSADGETLLVKDVDYTVSYTDNAQSGIARMTITGIGGYAGKSATVSFKVYGLYYADPEVTSGGDGMSWATAMSVSNALASAAEQSGFGEVWIKAGTLSAPAISIVNNANLTIRGGFAGTETTLAERQPGALTVFDGKVGNTRTSSILLSVENAAGANLVLERLKFCNAKSNGFVKTGGGSLMVFDCAVEANGRDVGKVYGRGLNAQSDGLGTLVVSNCVFAGNRCTAGDTQYGGFGLYAKSFKSAVVDDSLFVTNGYDLTVQPGKNYAGFLYARGSALYAENTPITVRGCRFAGNNCPVRKAGNDWCGGTIALEGACGGSMIENCALIGNTEFFSAGDDYGANCGGAIAIRLSSINEKATVRNCTIAYNITQSSYSGGGITVTRGDVDIENTILWQNRRYKYTMIGYGSDVQVQSTGRASIRHSFVTGLDDTVLFGANLAVDEDTVFAVDPRLVTSTATFESLLTVTDAYQYYTYTNPTIYEDLATMDAHLLSAAGYCVNGGAVGPATNVTSTAIDMGDPAADRSNEPSPNGGRLNLGAYGNTAAASKSVTGQPEAEVEVTFPDGLTRPLVRITMGLESGLGYSATVRLTCSSNGVVLAVNDYPFISNGDVIEWKSLEYLQPGAIFTVMVAIAASGASAVAYNLERQVTGELPPYYGKGGGAHVVHVREGADCRMDGTSWTDAFPDIKTALKSIQDDSKTEMWLAVSNDHLNESTAIAYPLTIRGGFAGVENSPDERPEGSRSTLDGREAFEGLAINNSAAVSIERIVIMRGLNCGLIKSGAGDLHVSDCHFLTNGMGRASNQNGKGARVGGTKTTTVVTFSNCVFRCNRAKPGSDGGCSSKGAGINASNLKCLRLENCLFVHNGIHLRGPGGGNSYEPSSGNTYGSAVYSTAPVSAVGCRFAANFCQVLNWNTVADGGNGGIVRLHAGAEGSAFTNCAWVANGEEITWPGQGSAGQNNAGALTVLFGSKEGTVDVNNCTFAYNLTDGYEVTAGLNIILGTANVRNSIFFGNIIGGASKTRGRDISLRGESVLNVAYTMFGEEGTNSITCAETATTNFLDGVVFGNPLFVTPNEEIAALVRESTTTAVGGSKLIFWDWTAATAEATYAALENVNCHLRGGLGYHDEATGSLVTTYSRGAKSPCIDKGDPKSEYHREPAGYNGRRVNMGYYGNSPWASMSQPAGSVYYLR